MITTVISQRAKVSRTERQRQRVNDIKISPDEQSQQTGNLK
jgi:hypothetical protein